MSQLKICPNSKSVSKQQICIERDLPTLQFNCDVIHIELPREICINSICLRIHAESVLWRHICAAADDYDVTKVFTLRCAFSHQINVIYFVFIFKGQLFRERGIINRVFANWTLLGSFESQMFWFFIRLNFCTMRH